MKTHFTLWIYILVLLLPIGAAAQDKLKIKDPGGNVLMEVRPEGVLVRKFTTIERLAVVGLTSAENGLMVYDTDTKSIWLWRDTQWIEVDGVDLVDDADHDPTNELDTWATLPGVPAGFSDGIDNVDDADHDPTNELDTWATLPGIPSGFSDGVDNVDDADHDPTNELQDWSTLPGIPVDFADGTDNVNDADSDPLNEKNTALTRNGQLLELTDAGGTLAAPIGWAIGAGTVFNSADNVGIGTSTPAARLHVSGGAVLINGATGATPVSGAGTRMMWVPGKQAFRAGVVTSTQWDAGNIGQRSFVGGGTDNMASGFNAIVAGGGLGSAIADGAFVGGGFTNTASGINSFIGSGDHNIASGNNSNVSGGSLNTASEFYSFVGGGSSNTASGGTSFVGGGLSNTASGYASFTSGRHNVASASHSFAGGGIDNIASGVNAVVAGGSLGSANANDAFVGGGYDNTASEVSAFVGGGTSNTASGGTSFVGGGLLNTASGYASFVAGRESTASGNHSFAGGTGLLAKSFNETVFGSYNADYTPASTTGFVNTDRLFVIGNGTNSGARSNAMTVLKDGKVGFGTSSPKTGVHVVGSKGLGEHVMVIENTNHLGSGLNIKIDGSHPLFVLEPGVDSFFVTHPFSGLDSVFGPIGDSIKNFLLGGGVLSLSSIHLSEIASPGGLFDQLGMVDMVSGGVCKGVETLVDLANNTFLSPIQLPNLPLDGIPDDIPNIPNLPTIPTIPDVTLSTPGFVVPLPNALPDITINPPDVTFHANFINTPISAFNSNITSTVNTGIASVNTVLENGYDKLRSGISALDNLAIDLPQWQMPDHIGPITCPEVNPWDNVTFQFQSLNPNDYNILNPLSKSNAFITFSDNYDNKLGAITAQSMGEFSLNYFSKEKVLEIGSYVVGMFAADGGVVKNLMKLGKEAIAFYKATDQMGVLYSSGHGDYAEWLERENQNENIGYGDIIGIKGGKISLAIDGAEQIMVVSQAPIVLGNTPQPGHEANGNNVAFIGQVPVKVMGPVTTGDFIIANHEMPGYGIAVPANEITADQLALAVGKSWETNLSPGFKFVNTIVGMHNNGWAAPVTKMQQRLNDQEAMIETLSARLDKLEYGNPLMASTKSQKH